MKQKGRSVADLSRFGCLDGQIAAINGNARAKRGFSTSLNCGLNEIRRDRSIRNASDSQSGTTQARTLDRVGSWRFVPALHLRSSNLAANWNRNFQVGHLSRRQKITNRALVGEPAVQNIELLAGFRLARNKLVTIKVLTWPAWDGLPLEKKEEDLCGLKFSCSQLGCSPPWCG